MIITVTLNPSLDRYSEIESFKYQDVLRMENFYDYPSGKGVNVSCLTQSFGLQTTALGFTGGPNGEKLQAGLQVRNVPFDFTSIQGLTRSNLTVFDRAAGKEIKLNEPGPKIQESEANELLAKIKKYAAKENIFVLSGSLPPGLTPNYYSEIIKICQRAGSEVFFDTESSIMQEALKELIVNWIKPNIYETQRITGIPNINKKTVKKALENLKDYAMEPLITASELGVYFEENGRVYNAIPPAIEALSTVGAGDSFTTGFLCGLLLGKSKTESVKLGAACGTATAAAGKLASGGEAAMYLSQIEIKEVK